MKKSEITKKKITKAAEAAFADKGFFGSRVDEIAAEAGVNKRMIYEHFGSKENLYIAVLEEVYSKMADTEKELLIREMNPVEAIKAVVSHYFSFLSENPAFIKTVMWDERCTTVSAHTALNFTNTRGKKRKGVIDTLSAQIILQNALDRLR